MKDHIRTAIEKMTSDQDPAVQHNRGWFSLDEILYVSTVKLQLRLNQSSLLAILRELHTAQQVQHRQNRWKQHEFRLGRPVLTPTQLQALANDIAKQCRRQNENP